MFALIQIFCLQGMLIHQERRAELHSSELQPHLSRPQMSLLVCWGLENSHPPGTWGLQRGQHPQPGLFSPHGQLGLSALLPAASRPEGST